MAVLLSVIVCFCLSFSILFLSECIHKKELWFMLKPTDAQDMAKLKNAIFKLWLLRAKNNWDDQIRLMRSDLYSLLQNTKALPGKIKRRFWHKHILLAWHRLWIRKDEFHSSLDMDPLAMLEMDDNEKEKYCMNLAQLRQIAHDRDLAAQDAKFTN